MASLTDGTIAGTIPATNTGTDIASQKTSTAPSGFDPVSANPSIGGQIQTPKTASTPSPVTRTEVTLGNGNKVYYDNTGKAFDSAQGGNLVSNTTIAASKAPPPVQPPTTPITNPVPTPTGTTATPTVAPTTANGTSAASAYTSSVKSTLDTQQSQLASDYQTQINNFQSQIDAAKQAATDAQQMADAGLASEGSTAAAEAAQKQNALQQEQQQYQENYQAIQGLAAKASALVDTATAQLNQINSQSGFATIMNARAAQTTANLTGELAVINGAVAIYRGQIGDAQNQLKSATDAITSIYGDQLSYYQNVVTYYDSVAKTQNANVASLSKDQQTYVQAQISQLQDQIKSTQATADMISKAMVDPATAITYAKAGITLNDSIPQINAKLAVAQEAQNAQAQNDAMTKAGYSLTPTGANSTTVVDQYGKTWYKAGSTSSGTQADRTSQAITTAQNIIDENKPLPGGIPITDSSGNITPEAWKALITQAPSEGLTRSDFIKAFANYIVAPDGTVSSKYSLTPSELNLIGAVTR